MKKLLLLVLILSGGGAFAENGRSGEIVVSFLPSEFSLNPLRSYTSTEAQIYTALYEGLVNFDPATMDPVPAAAQSWTVSPDGKTYTFRIRDEARYRNGDPVTAGDFRSGWLKFLDPEIQAEYSFFYDIIEGARDFRTGKNRDPESVKIRVLSPKRLQVVLEEPATHFLKILCHHSFVPIHPSLLEKASWNLPEEIQSNGPYFIEERGKDFLLLAKNPHYWEKDRLKTDRIRLLFLDDPGETVRRFNNYEIHWVVEGFDLDRVLYKDAIIVNPLFATQYFFFSHAAAPWNDRRVRRALALLLPWEEIRSPDHQFIPAKTLVPPIPQYPEPETIQTRNREEAKKLLKDAGYPDGRGLPPVIFRLPEGGDARRTAALMAAAWKEEGIESTFFSHPYSAYFEALKKNEYTIGSMTWIGDFADPLAFLQMWTSDSNLNDGGYADPVFDGLLKTSMKQSGAERYKTLSEAESLLLSGAEVLPMGHSPAINLIDLHFIDGWYRNPLDIHPFKYLAFAPYRPLPGLIRFEGFAPLTK